MEMSVYDHYFTYHAFLPNNTHPIFHTYTEGQNIEYLKVTILVNSSEFQNFANIKWHQ